MLQGRRNPELSDAAPERPEGTPVEGEPQFGSDVVARTLRDIGIRYVALNPGASFRGLHDSLVNHLGNRDPQLLLCLHEEHAVAIAHGFAKVTGRPMAAAVHANVGLMHATMAIFNAWCDRMPMLVLGATGPLDAAERRPWIDWIHTAADQGALVRPYVKWDAQPASAAAAREALLRGAWLASNAPAGPVYVNLDARMQETACDGQALAGPVARWLSPARSGVDGSVLDELMEMVGQARAPVILAGRASRDEAAWARRVQLAERLGARVISDVKTAVAFPSAHPLHVGDLRGISGPAARAALGAADLVIALDWVDLQGALAGVGCACPVVRVGLDHTLHNGWSMDHQAHPPADLVVACEPDALAAALLERLGPQAPQPDAPGEAAAAARPETNASGPVTVADIAATLRRVLDGRPTCLSHVTLSWDGTLWPFAHPLDFLGSDGGGGLGSGPGNAVGAALALRDMGTDRLPMAVCGDGDFLMGCTALWTAVHYRIPLLLVVANNRSFYNDEVHQERVARMRGRPVANKWIGMRMEDPTISLAGIARAQGCVAFGPVEDRDALAARLSEAVAAVDAGGVAVVEVITDAGYSPALVAAVAPEQSP